VTDRPRRDIVVTWPKTLSLDDYLRASEIARIAGLQLNYRVGRAPSFDFGAHRHRPGRVYVVYDGRVRGYHELLYTAYRDDNEVLDERTKGFWPAGWYIVRDPAWHPLPAPLPVMRGFQGWHWYYDADA
jgi:hypothetical protein